MVLLPLFTMGQQNLVPNGSFEEITTCPWEISQAGLAMPWTPPPPSSADLYNACDPGTPSGIPHLGVPANATGNQPAHSGEGYVGIFTYNGALPDGREYLQVMLTEPLEQGKYIVSFWASLADEFQYAVSSIGVYLSDTAITYTGYEPYQVEPSVQSPEGVIMSNKDIWYHITDTFTTRYGGEEYLLLGNFKTAEESDTLLVPTGANNRFQSYYYIDDVSVVALGDTVSGIAPPDLPKGEELAIYPNPSNGVFEVQASTPLGNSGTLILYDMQGRAVLRQRVKKGTRNLVVDAKALSTGIYNLRLQLDDGSSGWQRVVVQ